jgi:ketosteroid isomerase-like protein
MSASSVDVVRNVYEAFGRGDVPAILGLARVHGELRATGEQTGYTAAHAWTVGEGTAIQFAEYVNAPLTLPAAGAATS